MISISQVSALFSEDQTLHYHVLVSQMPMFSSLLVYSVSACLFSTASDETGTILVLSPSGKGGFVQNVQRRVSHVSIFRDCSATDS